MGNVTGCAAEDVRIGMAVRAYALKATPDIGILMWEAASE
jgi:hypothetical protein